MEKLYAHYLSLGVPPKGAAALVGVFSTESGTKLATGSQGNAGTDLSGILSGTGGAYGIASWNGPRQTDLANYAAARGKDPSDLITQGEFALWEMKNKYPSSYDAVMGGGDIGTIARVLVTDYERPAAR